MERMSLEEADDYAAKVLEALTPFCDKIAVAGSIRRRRPTVGDIDLVAMPRDMNGYKKRAIKDCELFRDGGQNFTVVSRRGIHIDTFFAEEGADDLFGPNLGNWGTLLLCRTGSRAFNVHLCDRAKSRGLRWHPYKGMYDDTGLIASATEEEVLAAVGLPFIPPEKREA